MTARAASAGERGSMLYLSWQLEPVLLGGLVTAIVAYFMAVGPLRSRLAPGERFPVRHAAIFTLGMVFLFVNEGSPLHDLAERYLLSAHMIQHLLLSYAIAPIILAGIPTWLVRAVLLGRAEPVSRALLRPLVTFLAFSLVLAVYHVPALYNLALANTSVHHAFHFVILIVSLMLWFPLMSTLPELPRPQHLTRLIYLFLLPVAQLPIFAGVAFSDIPLYSAYEHMPTRAFGLSVMEDQALAGVIMKVAGLFAFGIAFIVIFFSWYRSERGTDSTQRRLPMSRAAAAGTKNPHQ